MKKSRRQKQRRRRQSRKPRISRGGAFLTHAIEAANICEHTIHLIKNVNRSSEVLKFCQKIDTVRMNELVTDESIRKYNEKLIKKFTNRKDKLTADLNFIATNNVVTTIVSFAVRFFSKPGNEIKKLTDLIPEAETIANVNKTWTDKLFDTVNALNNASKIMMWGEWYNTELTESTNNLIAVVTEMIGLKTLPMMKPTVEDETTQIQTNTATPPTFSEVVTRPPDVARSATIVTIPRSSIQPVFRPGSTSFSFTPSLKP